MTVVKIVPEKNVFDDGFLDLIGREFATHEQGLAEWVKNAADAVLEAGLNPGVETIFLDFTDGTDGRPPVFGCIDFVGMTMESIESAFKPWGRWRSGERVSGRYGGYGMGGKFYMRQMFASSYLIGYARGLINVFGFNEEHAYGYAEGYRNRRVDPAEALLLAGVDSMAGIAGVKDAVVSGERGFSAFRGVGPKGVEGRIDVESLCAALRDHPQAQHPLRSHRVCVIHNGAVVIRRLRAGSIPRKSGFEKPWVRRIPALLPGTGREMDGMVRLAGDSRFPGTLTLFVADRPLVRRGKMASLNRIDFMEGEEVVASYRMEELDLDVPYGESIFGRCRLSRGEFAGRCRGTKTRDRLVDTPESRALLRWVREQVVLFSEMVSGRSHIPEKG
ncbi:MAG: hypothetical protein JRJ26_13805 [Deltaproteobacteria bacterium]|nr:hypothetical protein [Deltaproteobacteria bacterium]